MDAYAPEDIARLHAWRADGADVFDQHQRMMAHPRFPSAGRRLGAGMQAIAERDEALDSIFKDAGRYVAAMWAFYLHIVGSLTLPALKAVCAGSGLLSPGRARALLLFLLHLGYFELVEESRGGRAALYRPTQGFLAVWRDHLRVALDAAEMVEPAASLLARRLDEPGVTETFSRIQAEGLLASTLGADVDIPFYSIFMNRHAGTQILWTFLGGADEEAFPTLRPIPFSVTGAARRFKVSRIHVRRMLDDAVREGLIEDRRDGTILLVSDTRSIIQSHYALQLVHLLGAASRAIEELG